MISKCWIIFSNVIGPEFTNNEFFIGSYNIEDKTTAITESNFENSAMKKGKFTLSLVSSLLMFTYPKETWGCKVFSLGFI